MRVISVNKAAKVVFSVVVLGILVVIAIYIDCLSPPEPMLYINPKAQVPAGRPPVENIVTELKKDSFQITGGSSPRENYVLYFNFVSKLVESAARISGTPQESLDEKDINELEILKYAMESSHDDFQMLRGDLKHRISEVSESISEYQSVSLLSPSSRAVARLLGYGMEFLDALAHPERIALVESWMKLSWPAGLSRSVCSMSGTRYLPTRQYIASVFLQYAADCEVDRQKQRLVNQNIFDNLVSRRESKDSGRKRVCSFVLKSSSTEDMEPVAYVEIIRDVLFFLKFDRIVDDTLRMRRNSNMPEELKFATLRLRKTFDKDFSTRFGNLHESKPRRLLGDRSSHLNADDYLVYKLLKACLSVDEEVLLRRDDEIDAIARAFSSYLNEISDEAHYYLPESLRKIPMKEYIGRQVAEFIRASTFESAERLETHKDRDFNIQSIGISVPAKDYLLFVLGLLHSMKLGYFNEHSDEEGELLRILEEELLLCMNEGCVCDKSTPDAHSSTRAILRLWGGKTDLLSRGANPGDEEYSSILHKVESYRPSEEAFSTPFVFEKESVSFRRYLALAVREYFKESREEKKLQELANIEAYKEMNKEYVVKDEDGSLIEENYFEVVKAMFIGVFCNELQREFKKALVDANPNMLLLGFHLERKAKNVGIFFSNTVLGRDEEPSEARDALIKRVLGNDTALTKNLRPGNDDKALFDSILRCIPTWCRGVVCDPQSSGPLLLADLVAKALTEYIKASPVQNSRLMNYLLTSE